MAVCDLLAEIGARHQVSALTQVLDDPSMDVRLAAANALLRIERREQQTLSALDWIVIALYAFALLAIGWYYARRAKLTDDYLLGGRKMSSVAMGLSLFGSLLSTLSYLAWPGEMMRYGPLFLGGMIAYPFAYLFTAWFVIPTIVKLPVTSAYEILVDTKRAFEKADLPCSIVSAGGTGSYHTTARVDGITEIQAGGGIFMDNFYCNLCQVPNLDFAYTVLTTVTSRPGPDRAITDAGRKTLNRELQMPTVREHPELEVTELSAEHGWLRVHSGPGPAIGERLEWIPGYVDFTTMLHDHFIGVRNGVVEEIFKIDARGRVD